MQAPMTGDLELEWRLEAYAAVRLSPSARAAARMRARVMREARIQFAAQAASPELVTARSDVSPSRRRSIAVRRAAGLLLAAALSLGVAGGAMAAAQAGGPLYSTRMWLETVTLPAGAGARTDAEIVRLGSRMKEVIAAARRGDQAAVAAALTEYERIAGEALSASDGNSAATDRLRVALDRHVAVLATVAAKVPLQARESIEANIQRSIEHNGATLDRMQGKPAPPASNGGGSGNQPAATTKPDRTPKPTAAATPERTPRPDETPRAQPTEHPQPTPITGKPSKAPPAAKPDKTPPAHGRSAAP